MEGLDGADDRRVLVGEEVERAAVDEARRLGDGDQVDACDEAEVVAAALERPPEVGVGGGVGVDCLAGGEDDFEVLDGVGGEAFSAGEEGEAA